MEAITSLVGAIQFSSGLYLVLLTCSVIGYFALPGPRTRAVWLLAISVSFYSLLSPGSIVVLFTVTSVSYLVGRLLGPAPDDGRTSRDRGLFAATLVLVVGVLIASKYLGFLARIGNGILGFGGMEASLPVLRIALPLGISFWTFQSIAYVVDVYNRKAEPERNVLYYALSVVFFPIVTSGPITRVQALVGQLRVKHRFDYGGMQSGLVLIGRGFFKKLMIADFLVVFVNSVFVDPQKYSGREDGSVLLVAAVFFAFQLYFDFSGYTDIVRGSARLFGVELPINFRAPYFAQTVREFWRRWHITLMDWLREYVYIPLGGNRLGARRRHLNLLAVFAISGLWHGAGFTYLVWGLLNGFYMIAGELLAPFNDRVVRLLHVDRRKARHRIAQTAATFVLVTIAWVFFRADSLADAVYVVTRMFVPTPWVFTDGTLLQQGLTGPELAVALASSSIVFVSEWFSLRSDLLGALNRQHAVVRWAVYYALIMSVVVFGAYGGVYKPADFIYFKY